MKSPVHGIAISNRVFFNIQAVGLSPPPHTPTPSAPKSSHELILGPQGNAHFSFRENFGLRITMKFKVIWGREWLQHILSTEHFSHLMLVQDLCVQMQEMTFQSLIENQKLPVGAFPRSPLEESPLDILETIKLWSVTVYDIKRPSKKRRLPGLFSSKDFLLYKQ